MSEAQDQASLIASGTPPAPPPPPDAPPPPSSPDKPLVGAPASVEPLTLEALKFPDGIEVDQELTTGLLGVLNNQALSPTERGQALVDLHLKAVDAASEKASEFYRDLQDEWVGKAVEEFGGEEKLRPMLGGIARLVEEYGGTPEQVKELRDVFTLTGAGNNPRIVGFLYNVAKRLSLEGGQVPGGGPGSAPRTAAEILYPNMNRG